MHYLAFFVYCILNLIISILFFWVIHLQCSPQVAQGNTEAMLQSLVDGSVSKIQFLQPLVKETTSEKG